VADPVLDQGMGAVTGRKFVGGQSGLGWVSLGVSARSCRSSRLRCPPSGVNLNLPEPGVGVEQHRDRHELSESVRDEDRRVH